VTGASGGVWAGPGGKTVSGIGGGGSAEAVTGSAVAVKGSAEASERLGVQ